MQDYKCPYFVYAKHGNTISCEIAKVNAPDKQARDEFLDKFCGNGDGYKNCPFYTILDNYYKRIYEDWKDG